MIFVASLFSRRIGPSRLILRKTARFAAILATWGLVRGAPAEEIPVEPSAPATLFAPGQRVDPARVPAEWQKVLDRLHAQGELSARFEEHRYFPFKHDPVKFSGEMRLSETRGLSLNYLRPDPSIMIVDTNGILLRDGRGRERAAPSDPRATAAIDTLLRVMRFDLPALAEKFDIFAAGDEHFWHFGLRPKNPKATPGVTEVVVDGEDAHVRRLILRESPWQRVEIATDHVQTGLHFSPADSVRFFR